MAATTTPSEGPNSERLLELLAALVLSLSLSLSLSLARARALLPYCEIPAALSAARTVCWISIEIVIGPIPPGTGV